ncbi:MAG TPA: DUF1353 domain-containing protein [bacterium]|nr:DUF1353 domain-containing protein [bacterium]
MPFLSKLKMEHIERTVRYKLIAVLTYRTWGGKIIDMHIGFDSDGRSVPILLRSVAGCPFATKFPRPPFYHDFLLKFSVRLGLMSQFEAVSEYSRALKDDGASVYERKRDWLGVRLGDYWYNLKHWFRRKKKDEATENIVH